MKCGRKRKHLPDDDALLRRLFVDEGLSGVQIAKMFGADVGGTYDILRRIGINTGKDRSLICSVRDCKEPTVKIWHATNKCWYGRLCKEHRRKARAKWNRERQRRIKGITPDQYKVWQRKDPETLTDYEKEILCLTQAKRTITEIKTFLKQRDRQA